jgi:hypothetical protein
MGFGPVDDAYISLRYAANWVGGDGLVFNVGEVVEGYTNFLWVALEALLIALGVAPEAAMAALGWGSLALLCAAMTQLFRTTVLSSRAAWAPLAALLFSLHPMCVAWAASGLETCAFAALIALASAESLRASARAALWAGLWCALAGLTRPEAPAFALLFAGIVWWRAGVRPALRLFVAFVLPFGIYFAARWAHFGAPFPNTFYAKLDYGNLALVERGLTYVGTFVLGSLPWVLTAAAGVLVAQRSDALRSDGRTLALLAAAPLAVVVYEGGDHFAMFRFLVPLVPFLAALSMIPIVRASMLPSRSRRAIATACAAAVATAASFVSLSVMPKLDEETTNAARLREEAELARDWGELGDALRKRAPAGTTVATIAIGAIGYRSRLRIIDPHGIVDPIVARRRVRLGGGYAGHEKSDLEHVLAQRPDIFIVINQATPRPSTELVPLEALAWGEFNHALAADPRLHASYRREMIRTRDGRYMNLFVHRDRPLIGREPRERRH